MEKYVISNEVSEYEQGQVMEHADLWWTHQQCTDIANTILKTLSESMTINVSRYILETVSKAMEESINDTHWGASIGFKQVTNPYRIPEMYYERVVSEINRRQEQSSGHF